VDGNLAGDDLQMVADHLSHCGQCVLAVDDLRAFKAQVGHSLGLEYRPSPVAPVARGRRHRVRISLPVFGRSPALARGAALSVLVWAIAAWFVWRALHPAEPPGQNAVFPRPTPESPPAPVPAVAQLVAQLNDGQGKLTLDQEGRLSGADELPPAYQS